MSLQLHMIICVRTTERPTYFFFLPKTLFELFKSIVRYYTQGIKAILCMNKAIIINDILK